MARAHIQKRGVTGEEEALDKEVAQTPTLEGVAGGSRSANKQGLGSQGEADTEEQRASQHTISHFLMW